MTGGKANRPSAPVAFSAFGAAFAFYVLRYLPVSVLAQSRAASAAALSAIFSAALFLVPWGPSPLAFLDARASRRLRTLSVRAVSFFAGVFIGIAAARIPPPIPRWGVSPSSVSSVLVSASSDSRLSSSGRIGFDARLLRSGTVSGVSASASGSVRVFLSGKLSERPGRGAVLSLGGTVVERDGSACFFADRLEQLKAPPAAERLRASFRTAVLDRLRTRSWGGLACALLLGSRDELEAGEGERYAAAGCAHVLALSGMHLALFAFLAASLLKPLLGVKPASIASLALIVCFVYAAGGQPSLVRASLMYALGAAALWGNFRLPPSSSLSAAFLIQLSADPPSAMTLSFQLSYLALWGILSAGAALSDMTRGTLPSFSRDALCASIGAFLAAAPLSVACFGILRPVGLAAGLLIAPAASAVMALSLLWLATSGLPLLPDAVDFLLRGLVGANDFIVAAAARVPGVPFSHGGIAAAAALAAGTLLVYGQRILMEKRNRVEPID